MVGLLQTYQRRVQKWFLMSAIVGAVTGAFLAFYNYVVETEMFERLFLSGNIWLYLFAPVAGLLASWAIVRWLVPAGTPETTEAYIETYHSASQTLRLRVLPGRMLSTVATIGSGGSMGLEGPAVYFGATTGAWLQRQRDDLFDPDETKILEVAGAAAGIAAIFKAPLTGVMFALEAPYRDDLVRRALLPALTAAATGYLVYTLFEGPARLLQPDRVLATTYVELLLAIVLGLVCALVARLFVYVLDWSKQLFSLMPGWTAAAVAGIVTGALGVATYYLVDAPLTLGPGLFGTQLMLGKQIALGILPMLLVMKMCSTAFTAKGGGAGGMFFPLVFLGAAVGSMMSWIVQSDTSIYPVVGIAAMVGAGYRSPLAAVAFVAEATGSPGFVIPGLIAAATAQLAMGTKSISHAQLSHRWSGVESTLGKTVSTLLENRPTPPAVDCDCDLDTFAREHLLAHRSRALPVVDADGDCIGIIPVGHLTRLDRDEWKSHTVRDEMDPNPAYVTPGDTVGQAAEELVQGNSDYAVVIDDGEPVGVLTAEDVVRLEEVLGAVSRRRPMTDR